MLLFPLDSPIYVLLCNDDDEETCCNDDDESPQHGGLTACRRNYRDRAHDVFVL